MRRRFLGVCGFAAIIAVWAALSAGAAYGQAYEAMVLDAQTGQVLTAQNADIPTYPASLTKMMTLYLTFEALNAGRLRPDQLLYVSDWAASRAPTRLGLARGESVSVRDLILGVVTRSANDAATVLAEALGGSEPAFAALMTRKARQLGMAQTTYRNASGLPDPDQRTTARDIARLALALYHDFPREYRYFATQQFDFRGQIVRSHNHLMEWYQGLDGIKTGFIRASGFNLAASAVRNGHRLIGVVMGGRSARSRDQVMAALLDRGFAAEAGAVPPVAVAAAAPVPRAAPAPVAAAPVAVAAAVPVSRAAPAAVAAATVAVAAAAPAPKAVPAPLAAMPAPLPPAQLADDDAPRHGKRGLLGHVAKLALRHLSPVSHAEASPLTHEAASGWGIQLGAYRDENTAEHAARRAAALVLALGKPRQVVAPAKGEQTPLYRARVLHFTPKAAQAACAALHKRGIECSVVRPAAKLASR